MESRRTRGGSFFTTRGRASVTMLRADKSYHILDKHRETASSVGLWVGDTYTVKIATGQIIELVLERLRRERGRLGDRRTQTAQVPPQPIVTSSPSTMTGTSLLPLLASSIWAIPSASFRTSMYRTETFFLAYSSRAASVYGQPAFP